MLQWVYLPKNKTSPGECQQFIKLVNGTFLSEIEHHLYVLEQNHEEYFYQNSL